MGSPTDLVTMGRAAYLAGDGPADGPRRLRDVEGGALRRLILYSVGQLAQLLGLCLLAPLVSGAIGVGLGQGEGTFSFPLQLEALLGGLAAIGIAAVTVARSDVDRARLLRWTVVAWGVLLLAGSVLVTMEWSLIGLVLLTGAAWGASATLGSSLLFEAYPAALRRRAFSWHAAAQALTGGLVLIWGGYLNSGGVQLSWRAGLLVMGAVLICCAVIAGRVTDRGAGAWDAQLIAAAGARPGTEADVAPDASSAGVWEGFRQVIATPSAGPGLQLFVAFGVFIVPAHAYAIHLFEYRWGYSAARITVLLGVLMLAAVPGLVVAGTRPARPVHQTLRTSGVAGLIAFVSLGVAAETPSPAPTLICLAITWLCVFHALPGAAVAVLSVVHPQQRTRASAEVTAALAIGLLVGPALAGAFSARFGTQTAIIALAVAGVALSLPAILRAKATEPDIERVIAVLAAEADYQAAVDGGRAVPLLSCQNIDYAYGTLQVLFDVNVEVGDGEMVALLGTNGAGKSTLLRAICGLGYPTNGVVRYQGSDITYVPSASRVGLGITQIPGGKAVFGPMTVADNLRVYGYGLGRRRSLIDQKIDEVFAAFPRLGERRNQLASTLSGGEQQMLALGKAMILQPRLLLIDELSIGLAPIVTAGLLKTVREINARGTAVILVEQSVDIALSLVDRAYFMEKGQIRFDGASADLLSRDDILRAVFFAGHEAVVEAGMDAGVGAGGTPAHQLQSSTGEHQ